jgi:hypothetical protein
VAAACPTLLLGFSVAQGQREQIFGMSSLFFGLLLIAAGGLAYSALLLVPREALQDD